VSREEPGNVEEAGLTQAELEEAISPWFRGGGTARMIVETLLTAGPTSHDEARAVAKRLGERLARGKWFIKRQDIEDELELVQAASGGRRSAGKDIDWKDCLFSDDEDCPQCKALDMRTAAGKPAWRHGRLLTRTELRERIDEVRQLLNMLNKERPA
jgi:hypothetical protein